MPSGAVHTNNEMKIAPRSLRMALGASGRSAIIRMAVSRVGDRNLTLPECRSLSTSPWDLEAEILALRHQLTVLRRKAPKRLAFSSFDRLFFASLYRIAPGVVKALEFKCQAEARVYRGVESGHIIDTTPNKVLLGSRSGGP